MGFTKWTVRYHTLFSAQQKFAFRVTYRVKTTLNTHVSWTSFFNCEMIFRDQVEIQNANKTNKHFHNVFRPS